MPDWLSQLVAWFKQLYADPKALQTLVANGGMVMLTAIIFAETGLLVGFFLPGDSLLVAAGVVCSLGSLSFLHVLVVLMAAAILGDWVNFWMGAKAGNRIWDRPDSRFFKRKHLEEARDFYAHYGPAAIAVCRFIPIFRTFVPFAAGLAKMPFRTFMVWNALGGTAWVASMVTLGYLAGKSDYLRERLHLLLMIVISVSLIPVVVGILKRWIKARRSNQPTD